MSNISNAIPHSMGQFAETKMSSISMSAREALELVSWASECKDKELSQSLLDLVQKAGGIDSLRDRLAG